MMRVLQSIEKPLVRKAPDGKLVRSGAVSKQYVEIDGERQGMIVEDAGRDRPVLLFLHGLGFPAYTMILANAVRLEEHFSGPSSTPRTRPTPKNGRGSTRSSSRRCCPIVRLVEPDGRQADGPEDRCSRFASRHRERASRYPRSARDHHVGDAGAAPRPGFVARSV